MKIHRVEVTSRPLDSAGVMPGTLLYELWLDGKVIRSQISHLGMMEISTVLGNKGISPDECEIKLLPAV